MINQTIVNGDCMPVHPGELLRSGRFNDVMLVNGTTRDEGSFFIGLPENEARQAVTEEIYPAALKGFFGGTLALLVGREYASANYNSSSEAFAAATRDYPFSCPTLLVNKWAFCLGPPIPSNCPISFRGFTAAR